MKTALYRRDFSQVSQPANVDYKPQRYSHSAFFGPKLATVECKGDDWDLWELIHLIRAPVELYSDVGDCTWWGYLAEISASLKPAHALNDKSSRLRVRVGVNVNSMYNNVALAYTKVDIDNGTTGDRQTLPFITDALSVAEYGTRELIWTKDGATAEHAAAAQQMKLSQTKYPIVAIDSEEGGGESSVTLTCRGWGDTLGWRYFAQSDNSGADTATQVKAMITSNGQFIRRIDQDVTSGLTISQYRDGDNSALFYILQLLEMGTNNFRRMLAHIDQNRICRIYEEPASTVKPHLIGSDGAMYSPYGDPLRSELCTTAVWARQKDIVPDTVDTSILSGAGLKFIEETEYDVEADRLHPHSRGDLDAWDFPKVKDG